MNLLRRVLGLGAALLLVQSISLLAVPRTIVERVMGQVGVSDDVWIRLFAAAAFALALFHVLILRKLDELWWWCWGFVLFDGLTALIVLTHAAAGLPERSAAWPWWLLGVVSAVFTGLYVVGLARAGQEKPFA